MLFGRTAPEATVTVIINDITEAATSNKETGFFKMYLYNAREGNNIVRIYAEKDGIRSQEQVLFVPFVPGVTISSSVAEIILTIPERETPPSLIKQCERNGDLNEDGKVDLFDFSILMFYWHDGDPPCKVDLNADGAVNLGDFSIFLNKWTPAVKLEQKMRF